MTKARDLASGGFGLVLIKPSTVVGGTDNGKGTVSFSAVSSVSLNNVFNSTYDNYKVMITIDTLEAKTCGLRMRVSGSDASGATDYKWSLQYFTGAGNPANDGGSTGASSATLLNLSAGGIATGAIEIMNPFLAKFTHSFRLGAYSSTHHFGSFIHTVNTSYDGFTLISSSGTITGTVSVYGYNE